MLDLNKTLPKTAIIYLEAMKSELAHATIKRHKTAILRFHRWLETKKLSIANVSSEQLTEYHRWSKTQNRSAEACDCDFYNARSYIVWLIKNGNIKNKTTNFFQYSMRAADLPPFTKLFLKHRSQASKYAPARYRQLMNLFHNWLADEKLEVQKIKRSHIVKYLGFLDARGYTPKQLHVRRLHMRIYLDWLRDRNLTSVDCRDLFESVEQFRNFDLPKCATDYLAELETTLRDKTVISYKTGFQNFHRFIRREGVDIKKIKRAHCVKFMKYLVVEKKYSQSTRLGRLVNLRGYFFWLNERRLLSVRANDLIRVSDFPQRDETLPKPLPPKVDLEVQRRLAASDNMYHLGALLLRLTGMRIGELSNVNFDPVWKDDNGHTYIKVPIGKLHNERLVPIDEKTIQVIERIQQASLPHLRNFSGEPKKGKLLIGPKGGTALHNVYRKFKEITKDIHTAGSIHPHRLRHTFATTLMNAGLNQRIVMLLLGHKDLRMTYKYSLITSDTVYKEFFKALDQSQFKIDFKLPTIEPLSGEFDPLATLENLAKWLSRSRSGDRRSSLIIKRINRLRSEIKDLE